MARPKVVIIGGGFGGLRAATTLARHGVSLVLIDRKNHHTFQPLLYQVATAGLSPGEIAAPIRGVLRKFPNVSVLLGEVTGFDLVKRVVQINGTRETATEDAGDTEEFNKTNSDASVPSVTNPSVSPAEIDIDYDYLVVAAGATHSYFGHDEWASLATGLKTIEDATEIRRRVLLAFELAEREAVATGHHAPLNFVIIGGGATGVELAGTLAEIARKSLARDFRAINPRETRVILVEGLPRVLPSYPEDLSESARKQLEKLGVEVRTSTRVTGVEPGLVTLEHSGAHSSKTSQGGAPGGQDATADVLPAAVTLWAAGVQASPLGKMLGPTDRNGRVQVNADLSVPGHPNVFVIGDMAVLNDKNGKLLPGVAPVAIQEGAAVAKNIIREIRGKARQPFTYVDKGSLATIGRAAAVGEIRRLHVSGFIAWFLWIFVHILYLVGFRNRVLVLIEWAWAYFTYQRSARLITGSTKLPGFGSMESQSSKASSGGPPQSPPVAAD